MNQKFCHKCGAEMVESATFCPKCGEKSAVEFNAEPTPIQQYNMNLKTKKPKINIDFKKMAAHNIVPLVCLVAGVILFVIGIIESVPDPYLSSYGVHGVYEYFDVDVYNYNIEAELRSGEIAGAIVTKCVYIAVGLLISCLSLLKMNIFKVDEKSVEGGQLK